jgi:hypothetical protein
MVLFEPAEEGGFTVTCPVLPGHPQRALRVILPWHKRDLKRGTLASIIAQAALTVAEFAELL